jgi:hypothetical protein
MGPETSSLREQIQGISKRPKAQKTLIPLQEQVFVWRYLPAKQKYILSALSGSAVRILLWTSMI